ncbi:hypothetical protein [Pseudoalteromonas rubra]|nr:hypothetical protein [Pseudoalteromonas rubra]
MSLLVKLTFCIACFVASFSALSESSRVSLLKVIVDPERYDGKTIKVTGLLLRSQRRNPVFMFYGEDAARSGRELEAILLYNLTDKDNAKLEDGRHYEVEGKFDAGCRSRLEPGAKFIIEFLGCIDPVLNIINSTNGAYRYKREVSLFPPPPPPLKKD